MLSSTEGNMATEGRFGSERDYVQMVDLLAAWQEDPGDIRSAFLRLKRHVSEKGSTLFFFKSRPGISYSLRATLAGSGSGDDRLFAMVDIIDDDPENRWLSVCFYGDTITDPDQEGDLVPDGISGEDGYCFDLYQYDESAISYLEQRIDEAYENTLRFDPGGGLSRP